MSTSVLESPNRSAAETPAETLEFSFVVPCLNEAETIERVVRKARASIERLGLRAEIVVADNGSNDGSQQLAERAGARVVPVFEKGYGNALRGGIAAARGTYVIMGDADDSYDFSAVEPFIDRLRAGDDLVMGNRFAGGIMPGAMPWKNRYIGNPILSFVGRLLFGSPVRDFHCGLRGFSKAAYSRIDLQTTGMEFASEMVIKSCLQRLRVSEVPTVLHKDGRSRPPHLRPWRDGWRHLRFMLLFSPRWLFLYPGLLLLTLGVAGSVWLAGGTRYFGPVGFDIHSLLVAGFLCLIGTQLVTFAVFTKIFAIRQGLHPPDTLLTGFRRWVTLETGAAAGAILALSGFAMLAWAFLTWGRLGFGELDPRITMRQAIPAVVLMATGLQVLFGSFFVGLLGLRSAR